MNQLDGRILRSQKSQNLILDAIIKLINNGNLYPTAQEVAKESGIAIRTVFRQFADMESLLMKVDELINEIKRTFNRRCIMYNCFGILCIYLSC